jgi:hypothetical protein
MTTEPPTRPRVSSYVWAALCLAIVLLTGWDYLHHHRWAILAGGAILAAASGIVAWLCRDRPLIVSGFFLVVLASRILGYGVGAFAGLFEEYGWHTLLIDNWYVALIILYLPLMGLGWWAYMRRKP